MKLIFNLFLFILCALPLQVHSSPESQAGICRSVLGASEPQGPVLEIFTQTVSRYSESQNPKHQLVSDPVAMEILSTLRKLIKEETVKELGALDSKKVETILEAHFFGLSTPRTSDGKLVPGVLRGKLEILKKSKLFSESQIRFLLRSGICGATDDESFSVFGADEDRVLRAVQASPEDNLKFGLGAFADLAFDIRKTHNGVVIDDKLTHGRTVHIPIEVRRGDLPGETRVVIPGEYGGPCGGSCTKKGHRALTDIRENVRRQLEKGE